MKKYISLLALLFIISSSSFSQIMFTASMDGSQETPNAVMTNATGTAWLVLSADFKSITYSVTYARLSASFTAGHFHAGAVGVAGGVAFPLTFTGNTDRKSTRLNSSHRCISYAVF